MRAVVRQLRREGYAVDGSVRDRGTMQTGWIRVRGLLHEVGLSPHRDEVLAVKLDVDTKRPTGAETETSLVRKHASLRLHHHDRASLLAGKLHAVLCRPWAKGRGHPRSRLVPGRSDLAVAQPADAERRVDADRWWG